MAERRPFPPSARRRALALAAGLSVASPVLVGAAAAIAAIAVMISTVRAAAAALGSSIAAACGGHAELTPDAIVRTILELGLPVIGAAAIAAVAAHVVQTRSLWLPRRRLADAPAVKSHAVQRACGELGSVIVIGGAAFAWIWIAARHLASLVVAPLATGGWLLASFVVALAVAWVAVGTIDLLLRYRSFATALAMTPAEKRQDDRLAAADPRWRSRRAALARGGTIGDAIATAAFIVLGDDVAVAIAWDPRRQPVPVRTATGRRARASQILGLARRHRIAVHHAPALAAALADGEGPVSQRWWLQLAQLAAARPR